MMSLKSYFPLVIVCISFALPSLGFAETASIQATVTGPDGRTPKQAEVRVEALNKKSKAIMVRADRTGAVQVQNIEAGSYRVSAIVDGKVQSSQNVKVQANKPAVLTFKIPNTAKTSSPATSSTAKTKIVGQKRYVWVPAQIGSRFGGYWKEAGTVNKPVETGAQNVDVGGEGAAEAMQRAGRAAPPPAAGGH
jgi:hypothetical protein